MRYETPGLRADNAQGWMAAVGVLYILQRMGVEAQLRWRGVTPVYEGVERDTVLATLERYITAGSDILENLPVGAGNGKAALDLTAGRVNFRSVVEQMVSMVTPEHFTSALEHRWVNQDNITSLGWDIGAVKMAASISGDKAPDSSPHRGVLVGQWLAAEALPITGTGSRKKSYSWVTWSVPLDMGGSRAVIQAVSVDWGGVKYKANIGRNGQMGYLEPPRIVS